MVATHAVWTGKGVGAGGWMDAHLMGRLHDR
jgi:hypothetical protein